MEKHALRMKSKPGQSAGYRRRHDAIRPELSALPRAAGMSDDPTHLDEGTKMPFAILRRRDHGLDDLPAYPLMRKSWAHLTDIMQTNPDGSPVAVPQMPMLHMP